MGMLYCATNMVDEEDRRRVQSLHAPGTGGHRNPITRVTMGYASMGADHRQRHRWKGGCVSTVVTLVAEAWYDSMCQERIGVDQS